MSDDTIYRRNVSRAGRVTYEPVGRVWDRDVLTYGTWVVRCDPGSVSYHRVPEAGADTLASVTHLRDEFERAVMGVTHAPGRWCVADVADAVLVVLALRAETERREREEWARRHGAPLYSGPARGEGT